jgi:alpha-1,6-mannosyltransferase
VRFLGHVVDRHGLAALLATADVVLAPGPVEMFGLAALEALASGTPVVVDAASALPEVIGEAGVAVTGDDGRAGPEPSVTSPTNRPNGGRPQAPRAERLSWSAAVDGFLRAHGAQPPHG